jgi:hypothetical protein
MYRQFEFRRPSVWCRTDTETRGFTVPPHRPDPIAYLTGALSDAAAPSGVSQTGAGAKFTPQGHVLPWRGNTIICHINRDSPAHAALCDTQSALRDSPLARHFTYLPPASFHMTVFQGVSNGSDWPEGVPPDATMEQADKALADRLEGIDVPRRFVATAHDLFGGFSVTMAGADAAEEDKLRQTRRVLRDATGINPHDFDNYVFHITLGYLLRWLEPVEAQEAVDMSQTIFAHFGTALNRVTLGPLEFCTFEDMHHFEPVKLL